MPIFICAEYENNPNVQTQQIQWIKLQFLVWTLKIHQYNYLV